jgi:hypothetical protein
MAQNEPNPVISSLSGEVTKENATVEGNIVRLERKATWSLKVGNDGGTSIVWDDLCPSDNDAYDELLRTLAEEGMQAFLDRGNVIPFRR